MSGWQNSHNTAISFYAFMYNIETAYNSKIFCVAEKNQMPGRIKYDCQNFVVSGEI